MYFSHSPSSINGMAFLIPPVVNIFVVCKDDGHIETIACVTLIAEAFTVFVKTLSIFEISACGGAKKAES